MALQVESQKQIEIRRESLHSLPLPWTKIKPPLADSPPEVIEAVRQWCVAGGIESKWANRAQLYQLEAAWSSWPYFSKVRGLDRDSIKTGPRGKSDNHINFATRLTNFCVADFAAPPPAALPPPPQVEESEAPASALTPAQLADFQKKIAAAADEVFTRRVEDAKQNLASQVDSKVQAEVNSRFKLAMDRLELTERTRSEIRELAASVAQDVLLRSLPTRVEITAPTMAVPADLGLQHFKFPTLMRLLNARGRGGYRLNIWMTGPTGSGKTTAAENATKALAEAGQFASYVKDEAGVWTLPGADLNGLMFDSPFGGDSSLDADYKVIGYDKADGSFRWTTFLRIFCFGGVYIADEIDNWNPSALVALNAPLANGWVSTPLGIMRRHPDACIVAAANTWGLGATADYVGRTRLDAATVNRFTTKLDWPYDEKLELALATADGGQAGRLWAELIQSARREARTQGLQIILSPRNTFDGIANLNAGFTIEEVVEMNVLAGIEEEYKQTLRITERIRDFNQKISNSAPASPKGPTASEAETTAYTNFRLAIDQNQMITAIREFTRFHNNSYTLRACKDFYEDFREGRIEPSIDTFIYPPAKYAFTSAESSASASSFSEAAN